jgi:two-component system CheB/CheR fusion protein
MHDELVQGFSEYKKNTLARRVRRRMRVLQLDTVTNYIERLRDEPQELNLLFDDLLIGVSRFFRDAEAWKALEEKVIPELLAGKGADELRVWVPGCGSGEEVYGLAMLLSEAMERRHVAPIVRIFGTDIDEYAIEIARAGRYDKALSGLPAERRERFFVADRNDQLRANKALRSMCVFAAHDVIKDPSFAKLDLIACDSLLIYMNNDLQDRVVREFHHALKPDGWLFLARSEEAARNSGLFVTVDEKHRLFRRRETERFPLPDTPVAAPPRRLAEETEADAPPAHPSEDGEALDRRARRAVEKYALSYVIVGTNLDILRFSGGAIGRYLEPSEGAATLGLLDMVKASLRPALRSLVQRVFETGESAVRENLSVRLGGERCGVSLLVEPLDSNGKRIRHCVVAFRDLGAIGVAGDNDAANDAAALEHEVRVTRTHFNATIGDLETDGEELRSANKGYQAINEALKAANAELSQRAEALNEANGELHGLLESTPAAIMFLDRGLVIKRFTSGTREFFRLREGDRGRPIADIVTRLDYHALERDANRVLRDTRPIEREVKLADGEPRTFILRMVPYRPVDNRIDGVVITFTDITERKRREPERALHAELIRASHDAIIGHSLEGKILTWNPAAERIFGRSAAEAIGRPLTMLIPEERANEMAEHLEKLKQGETVEAYVMVCETREDARAGVEFDMAPIRDEHGEAIAASTIARDISPRLEYEAHRDLLLHELSHRIKNTLATVQSIMTQTLRNTPNIEAFAQLFVKPFSERIESLAKTHDLLTRGHWLSADLHELLIAELEPYANGEESRWKLSGEPIEIAHSQAIALGMAFHELATNAAKYGALSVSSGWVEVVWHGTGYSDAGRMLHLGWTEHDGPPVREPERLNFGTRLIREGLNYELEAEVNMDFAVEGLHCTIDFPLISIATGRGNDFRLA